MVRIRSVLRFICSSTLQWALSGHLLSYFAQLRLSQITAERIDAYRAAKVREREQKAGERPLSNSSINRTIQVLAQVLDAAQEYGQIGSKRGASAAA